MTHPEPAQQTPSPKPPRPPRPPNIDEVAVAAVQRALGAEHAAVWCYSLAVAFLGPEQRAAARTDADAHRELRSQIARTLSDIGSQPVSAQPAYATPEPVTSAATAAKLLVVAETDALAAWRSVMERTADRTLRKAALDALTSTAVRCARWRGVVGADPAVPQLPGAPETAR
ncbi:ferritin-like domain-containing protein [Pseudonocardia sp. CA-107938]|uniref:ferritin-like domain-containing protein n=1 Tax=Pseudonocardia sp. CA-107938 TaxID=3240021 RepID=UPI003D8EB096